MIFMGLAAANDALNACYGACGNSIDGSSPDWTVCTQACATGEYGSCLDAVTSVTAPNYGAALNACNSLPAATDITGTVTEAVQTAAAKTQAATGISGWIVLAAIAGVLGVGTFFLVKKTKVRRAS